MIYSYSNLFLCFSNLLYNHKRTELWGRIIVVLIKIINKMLNFYQILDKVDKIVLFRKNKLSLY
jgi:hypothetical protein